MVWRGLVRQAWQGRCGAVCLGEVWQAGTVLARLGAVGFGKVWQACRGVARLVGVRSVTVR